MGMFGGAMWGKPSSQPLSGRKEAELWLSQTAPHHHAWNGTILPSLTSSMTLSTPGILHLSTKRPALPPHLFIQSSPLINSLASLPYIKAMKEHNLIDLVKPTQAQGLDWTPSNSSSTQQLFMICSRLARHRPSVRKHHSLDLHS